MKVQDSFVLCKVEKVNSNFVFLHKAFISKNIYNYKNNTQKYYNTQVWGQIHKIFVFGVFKYFLESIKCNAKLFTFTILQVLSIFYKKKNYFHKILF